MAMRFMIGWWSSNSLREAGPAPFEHWISNCRSGEKGEELLRCALVEAISHLGAHEVIRRHYPDAKVRFCEVPPDWWSMPQSPCLGGTPD
jgi:hypothetical protein